MRKTKKVVALLLVMVLALSSLAGCGSKSSKKGPITLTVYSQLANYNGEQIGWFAKVMLDKFNVKLNIVNDADGVFTTRMESGNLGDIVIFGNDSDQYLEAANKGMLLDWEEDGLLDEYGAYIKENMPKALDKNRALTESGKLYGFGHAVATSADDHEAFFYHPDIRWDLYAKLGYPKVTTLEDYIDVLAQMKEIEPTSESGKETYGVSLFNDWDGDMVMFVKATGALYGYDEFGIGLYDVNTDTWQGALEDGGMYLRALKFYNQLYQRNLLDPDSMTQGSDGANEDYMDGVAFFNIFNFVASLAYNTADHLNAGKAMYALAAEDQNTINYGLNVFGGNRVWTIGAKTQYPELCMEIINWFSTPEGKMTTEYGPQGLTWDYDDDGKTVLTDLGLACRNNKDTEMTGDGYSGTWADGTNQMNNITWSADASNPDSNGETYNYLNWASYNATQNYDILNDWRNFTGFTTQDEYLESRPYSIAVGTKFSMAPRSEELDVLWQQVTTAIKDYSWKAIYAKDDAEFDSIVAEMQEKAKGYGYDECAQFCIEQAAIRKAAVDEVKAK
jgi:putative aldouronate transport system substrate-binding protein